MERKQDEIKVGQVFVLCVFAKQSILKSLWKSTVCEMWYLRDYLQPSQWSLYFTIQEHVDEMKMELSTTKVQNTEMERKQDEINVKVNQMKVRQDFVYFCVSFNLQNSFS
jgi:hypothetical protein